MKISKSLKRQITKKNLITREDLWQFIQKHKNETKSEFGGWLISQEVVRTDKMMMAIDLWNDAVTEKILEGRE